MKRSVCFFTLALFLLNLLFFSCSKERQNPRIYLDDSIYWAVCDEGADGSYGINSSIEDAALLDYKKLEKMHFCNLRDLVGRDGKIVWLKIEFELTEELKHEDLSMVIPYLHFADELYLNGRYIDDYGIMDKENLQDAGYIAHLFDFPEEFLNQNGKNTVYIKVLALGYATISKGVFVGFRQDGWAYSDIQTFIQSRIYMPFEGVMIAAFMLFLILFLFHRKERLYLYFSCINFFSIIFFAMFFAGDLPNVGFHGGLSFFPFVKISRCLSFFGMELTAVLFIFEFLRIKHHKIAIFFRTICYIFCFVYTIFVPDYLSLMKSTPFLLSISAIDLVLSFFTILRNLFYKQKQRLASYLMIGATPLLIAMISDFVIKFLFRNINLPYFSLLGWQITILFFFVYFSIQYRKISIKLEYLNTELENEVEIQTRQLKKANEQLDFEMKNAKQDVRTAALVQQKLFRPPQNDFSSWDIAVSYKPLSIVSGDFFNFYSMGDELYGVSLFDASGHGVSASLITMLAENIIQQNFKDANIYGEDISVTLERINSNFIAAKGDIENYLTGILVNLREHKGECSVSMVDAAHPYPELYHAEEEFSEELLPDAESPSFGPIGMDLIEVSYSPLSFVMKKDDVLVLFTDGFIEAMNEKREEFGRKELKKVLMNSKGLSAQEILSQILDALTAHIGEASPTDDVTIIIMKRK